jgi:hypothetical protein
MITTSLEQEPSGALGAPSEVRPKPLKLSASHAGDAFRRRPVIDPVATTNQ